MVSLETKDSDEKRWQDFFLNALNLTNLGHVKSWVY